MGNLGSSISSFINHYNGDVSLVRKQQRAARVREMWASCVDEIFLEHTNSVYIINENETKTLIVYVDESIFAAELNARRELIKLKFLQEFHEDIDEFKIIISRGSYKKNYPYKQIGNKEEQKTNAIPLDESDFEIIEEAASHIENDTLRAHLKKAMIADLKAKKTVE